MEEIQKLTKQLQNKRGDEAQQVFQEIYGMLKQLYEQGADAQMLLFWADMLARHYNIQVYVAVCICSV